MRIIAGEWGGRRIAAPAGRGTRPTTDRVREAWMSALQDEIRGARVLDLFAGSGALGLETLSRGAAHVTFVENAPAALKALRANLDALGATERSHVVSVDAMRWVERLGPGAFDLAFADPPYGRDLAAALARRWSEAPFARLFCLEHARADRLPEIPGARERRYGDTVLTFLTSADD